MKSTRLRRLLAQRNDSNSPDRQVLSVYREYGVIPKSSRSDNFNKTPEDLTRYLRVDPGDLVVNKMKAWSGSVGVSKYSGIVSGDYLVCRVSPELDSRFFHYLLRSRRLVGEMRMRSKGIRPSQERLYFEDLGDIVIDVPTIEDQTLIATFLDDQVARIDRAIVLAERQYQVSEELAIAKIGSLLAELGPMNTPLSMVASIIDTEHKTAPVMDGGGYYSAGTSSIRDGVVDRSRLVEIAHATYESWTRRGKPSPGDVLLTREAPVGQAALVSEADANTAIGQRVVLIRPSNGTESSLLLAYFLSPQFAEAVKLLTHGSLHPHLNMSDIARLRLPEVSAKRQKDVPLVLGDVLERRRLVRSSLLSRRTLLDERKQALITSAVTGEFDVSTASKRALAGAAS